MSDKPCPICKPGRPCVMCRVEQERARRAAMTAPAHAAHINPLTRIERDKLEAQHG